MKHGETVGLEITTACQTCENEFTYFKLRGAKTRLRCSRKCAENKTILNCTYCGVTYKGRSVEVNFVVNNA